VRRRGGDRLLVAELLLRQEERGGPSVESVGAALTNSCDYQYH
jgi:hypothetical protein